MEREKKNNTVATRSASLGGQRGGDSDKVQRATEVGCNAQSAANRADCVTFSLRTVKINLIFPGSPLKTSLIATVLKFK